MMEELSIPNHPAAALPCHSPVTVASTGSAALNEARGGVFAFPFGTADANSIGNSTINSAEQQPIIILSQPPSQQLLEQQRQRHQHVLPPVPDNNLDDSDNRMNHDSLEGDDIVLDAADAADEDEGEDISSVAAVAAGGDDYVSPLPGGSSRHRVAAAYLDSGIPTKRPRLNNFDSSSGDNNNNSNINVFLPVCFNADEQRRWMQQQRFDQRQPSPQQQQQQLPPYQVQPQQPPQLAYSWQPDDDDDAFNSIDNDSQQQQQQQQQQKGQDGTTMPVERSFVLPQQLLHPLHATNHNNNNNNDAIEEERLSTSSPSSWSLRPLPPASAYGYSRCLSTGSITSSCSSGSANHPHEHRHRQHRHGSRGSGGAGAAGMSAAGGVAGGLWRLRVSSFSSTLTERSADDEEHSTGDAADYATSEGHSSLPQPPTSSEENSQLPPPPPLDDGDDDDDLDRSQQRRRRPLRADHDDHCQDIDVQDVQLEFFIPQDQQQPNNDESGEEPPSVLHNRTNTDTTAATMTTTTEWSVPSTATAATTSGGMDSLTSRFDSWCITNMRALKRRNNIYCDGAHGHGFSRPRSAGAGGNSSNTNNSNSAAFHVNFHPMAAEPSDKVINHDPSSQQFNHPYYDLSRHIRKLQCQSAKSEVMKALRRTRSTANRAPTPPPFVVGPDMDDATSTTTNTGMEE